LTVTAATLRSAIGLRSTWFTVGVMSLQAPVPAAPLPYGLPLTLTGTLRGIRGHARAACHGGTWEPVGPVAAGFLKLTQRPTITTDYRLATTTAASAFVRIRVAPTIQITAFTTTEIAGSEQPVLAAAPVLVQQQNPDTTWATIATGTVNPDGTFSVRSHSPRRDLPRIGRSRSGVCGRQHAAANRGSLMRRVLPLLAVAALAVAAPAAAFTPTDPLATKQWYLQQDHAFDAWAEPPSRSPR